MSNAICHMKAEDFKGTVFKKPRIAFFRHLLSGRTSIRSNRAEENRRRLQIALEKCAWQSLEIHDKYIICRNCMKEISLDLDKKEFDLQLNTLYETSKIYGN
jgi:ribosomal protein L28